MKKTFLLISLLTLFSGKIFSQVSVVLAGYPLSTSGWTLGGGIGSGPAVVVDSEVRLANNSSSQSGYIYYNTFENVTACGQFSVDFDFKIANPGGIAVADGIAFFFINPLTAFVSGGGLGLPSPLTGFVLTLDTYDNDGDGLNPEVELFGYPTASTYGEGTTSTLAPILGHVTYMTDGNWHHVKITYNASIIKVYMNGATTPSLTGTFAITTPGYFGFSASTGAGWSNQYIKDVVVVSNTSSPIFGVTTLCPGSPSALGDSVTGGTWSSGTTATATVNASGVVYGVSPGTSVITYSYNAGACTSTTTVNVVAPPGAIGGALSICAGSSAALTNSTTGGTWTSGNTAMATITPAGGIVTGAAVGTAIITYSTGGSCYVTATVTVNTVPTSIAGTPIACTGGTTVLSDGISGGTWSSSNTGVATISPTGLVTGIPPAGTATITYTLYGICPVSTVVTVNISPQPIVGSAPVCGGLTISLTDPTAGGTWQSSNTSTASVGVSTGIVTGGNVGILTTATITYTAPGGCTATAIVTVNPLPGEIISSSAVCAGATTLFIDGSPGGTWSSSNTAIATIGSTGTLGGVAVAGGLATITYTLATGCDTTVPIVVNPLPSPILGTASLCEGGYTTTLNDTTLVGLGTWISSNTTTANIDPFSGVVTSGSEGTTTVTYQLITTGCLITTVVTVNPNPPTILGIYQVCPGATTLLYDAVTGGTWSSSNSVVASIGSSSGIVTGGVVTSGTSVTITYTAPTGCSISTGSPVSVYPLPPFITGTFHLCAGQSALLLDASGPGTWSSNNMSIATVTPGPALSTAVTGVSAGVDTIVYKITTTGCSRDTVVTVNATPVTITGFVVTCAGSATDLTDGGGGTWTSSSGAVATVGAITGVVTGAGPGTSVITYSTGGTCTVSTIVTVNAVPTAFTLSTSGAAAYCAGGAGVTFTLSSSTVGVKYQLDTAGIADGAMVSGTGTAISFGLQKAAGPYTVIATNTATGCSKTMGNITVTVNLLPAQHNITGNGSYCSGSATGVPIGLDGSNSGVTYKLYNGTVFIPPAVTGTGLPISFGAPTGAGTYIVTATNSSGCMDTMTGSAIIAINPLPPLFTVTGTGPYCAGGMGRDIGLAVGSTTGVSYQLFIGGIPVAGMPPLTGTGFPLDFGFVTTAGTYTVVATNITTGCTRTMTGSALVSISPLPVISGATTVCVGATIPEGPAGCTWSSSNTSIVSVGSSTGFVSGVMTGTATITCTSAAGCSSSEVITVSSSPGAIIGANTVCVYATTPMTDAVTGGLWSVSPITVATIGSLSGIVTGVATGPVTTITYSLGGSGCTVTKTLTVTPAPGIISGATALCMGASTLFGDATTGGAWTSSNTTVATISSPGGLVVTGTITGTTTITYTLGGCTSAIIVTVNPTPSAIVGPASVCAGSSVVFTDPGGGGWISSNTTAATVDVSGNVSGATPGTSTITYSLGGSCVATKIISVNAITSVSGITSLCVGTTTTLNDGAPGGTWSSSNTTVATVPATPGSPVAVSGVAHGTSTITYITAAGCSATTTVTVNDAPSVIGGPSQVCAAACITLSDAVSGGTWSSTSSAVTVNSTSGQVCGLFPGGATIIYSLGFGCTKSAIVTVNSAPPVPLGITHVCMGLSTSLTDAVTGGTWSSVPTSVATVNATTGTVWGAATPGTATITYSPPTGCPISITVTVNPLPGAILGGSSLCVGSVLALTDGTSGGTWSSSSTAATAGAGTGFVTGDNPGVTTVTYALTGTGCSVSEIVTVLPPPPPITGGPMVCAGLSTTLHDATSGGAWATGPSSLATINPTTGVLWGVSSGTVLVSYTSGCTVITSIIVNALSPITGSSAVCAGLDITLTDTTAAGIWSSTNTSVATVIAGVGTTGNAWGVIAGTDTIIYTLPTGCVASKIITVNPAPPPVSGVMSVCAGSTTTLTDIGGGTWASGNTAIATVAGNVVYGVTGTAGGIAPITFTVPGTGCPAVAMVTVNPVPSAIGGPGAVCLVPGNTINLTDGITGGAWSSGNTAIATIDEVSGVLTGVAIGHATIVYTIPSGCTATAVISVDALPSAILGTPAAVCAGSMITLTDATFGGSWSSGNSFVATVDPSSGDVFGVTGSGSVGEAIISYTVGAGCPAITIVTVNPLPDAIVGTTVICQFTSMTLTDGTPGGTWMSSDTSVGHIDTFSGNLTAQGFGGTTITYTAPTGCTVTLSILVNPAPAPITGSPAICLGLTTTLTDASGGTWSSSNTLIASVDASGTVYGLTAGTAIITNSPGGCPATLEVTVTPAPSAITGNPSVCSGATITLGDAVTGGTWSSSNTAVATVNLFTGAITGVTTVLDIAYISYSTGAGCTVDTIVTVNPLPSAISIPTPQVCAGSSEPVFDGTGGGTWSSSNTEIATILPSGVSYYGASAGVATISFIVTGTGCAATDAVTVNPVPAAIVGSHYICLGSTATLTNAVTGGAWSVTPTGFVSVASPASGVIGGSALGSATVIYTLAAGCDTGFNVTVEPLPAVYTVTGGGSYCNGGAGDHIGLSGSSVGVIYLLYRGVTATGTFAGTGAPLDFGLQTVAGPYTVIATTTSTGCNNIMTGSATIVVMPTVTPSVNITPSGNPVCSGTSTIFTAVPGYGGLTPAYIWTVNGVAVGALPTYTFVPADGDIVGVTMASTGACPFPATASNTLTMSVLAHERPAANISITPGNPVCAGTGVIFTAVPSYGGPSPAYVWMKNGTPSGVGGIYSYMPVNGDMLYVHMTSNYLCRLADTVSSSSITMVVDTPVTPSVSIVAKPGAGVAIGQFDTLTAVVTSAATGTLSYQWLVNELPVSGATTNTFISNNFSNASEDSVTCQVTSEGVCTATSFGWTYVSVHPAGVATITTEGEITIVPNPNKGEFTIKGILGTLTDQAVSIELTDMLGQAVYKEQVTAHGGKLDERISLGQTVANGMYLLNLRSDEGNMVFHIVIEQ